MVRGPRIGDQFPRITADRAGLSRGFSTADGLCDFVQGELISVLGTFRIERGRRAVAGLTVNKDQKKARESGLNLSYERVLVYAFNSILGGTLAPVDALTF